MFWGHNLRTSGQINKRSAASFTRGLTFMDVLIGITLISLVFFGLFGVFRLSLELIVYSKTKSGALALATQQLEYLRSLPYDDVGTSGGIPSGSIPQTETIVLNNITYTMRTLVQYVDAPEDGEGIDDETGVTVDYKVAKIEMQWVYKSATSTVALVTNIVPKGVESLTSGGTLRINVFDALANPVSNASVRIVNDTLSPAVDTTVFTNIEGSVIIPGAPPGTGYEITVSKTGYSSAQTYDVSGANPNPSPGHLTVTHGNTTTASFAIDELAGLSIVTVAPPQKDARSDTFADSTLIASQSDTTVTSGALQLAMASSTYLLSGSATTTSVSPSPLYAWETATTTFTAPANTSFSYQFYSATNSANVLIPDSQLPGNAAGLTDEVIDLSDISPTAYPNLFAVFTFTSVDGVATPELDEQTIGFWEGPTPISGVAVDVQGTKTIGTDGSGEALYKYSQSHTSDGDGEVILSSIEWDTYTTTIDSTTEGYDTVESCPPQPLSVNPGEESAVQLTLEPNFVRSLLVVVRSADTGSPIVEGATVTLSRSGYSQTTQSSACGSAFFRTPPSANDYTLTVEHASYQTATMSPLAITSDMAEEIILSLP